MGAGEIARKVAGFSAQSAASSRLVAVAITGNFISIILSLCPAYTFVKPVMKEESVGDRMVYTYLIAFFNSMMWALYTSVSLPHKIFFFISSAVGFICQIYYIIVYIYYADCWKKRTQVLLLFFAVDVVAFIMAELVASMVLTDEWSSTFIAVIASLSGLSMHIFPAIDVVVVMQSKKINNMNPVTPLISLFGATTWTAYGFISTPMNLYIVAPNLLGIVSAVLQIVVYVIYHKTGSNSVKTDANQVGGAPQDHNHGLEDLPTSPV